MSAALTRGAHHIGLTVSKLEESAAFFTQLLGWREVRRDENYPAIFVTDGTLMISLWRVRDFAQARAFDKSHAVGLHHIALMVASSELLNQLHTIIAQAGLRIEFAPEWVRGGPAMHMMCYEPSGIRVEFIWPGV